MSAQLMDGKALAAQKKATIRAEVERLARTPGLAVVLVGENPASQIYVRGKARDCEECGIRCMDFRLPAQTTESELLTLIAELNGRADVDGILVQLPLPEGIRERRVLEAIAPEKDVDAFHPENVGRLVQGQARYLPCTPAGVMELLRAAGVDPAGRRAVIVGRSNIVGRPIANLLSQKGWDCTVTLCHSRTKDLKKVVRGGDIVIAALGKAEFVTADMVKDGAVVVDVGITRVPSDKTKSGWKLLGDVKFDEVAPKCSYITPVPGGVGPMTIISLMKNTLKAARREVYK